MPTAAPTKETEDKSNLTGDLNFDVSEIFLPQVADYRGIQCIMFISLKPAKWAKKNAETVFANLLAIFAQGKS